MKGIGYTAMTLGLLGMLFSPAPLLAQAEEQFRVEVLTVLSSRVEELPGLNRTSTIEELRVRIISGERAGEILILENDYFQSSVGDRFFVTALETPSGEYLYSVGEPDRRLVLIIVSLIAVASIVLLGGMKGVRALLALAGSIGVIILILVPALLSGASPIVVGIGIAVIILALVMGFAHGINKTTLAAFIGTAGAVVLAGVLASAAVYFGKFSGIVSDDAAFLNLATGGVLDLAGIFLAAIIIGMLGVLDDVAVSQAATVRELLAAGVSKQEALTRSLRVGREHVGALVNTLALAYAGASLPLLLIFFQSTEALELILNRELFAAEVIRTAVGTFGIVLAVPLTTLVAVWLLTGKEKGEGHTHACTH